MEKPVPSTANVVSIALSGAADSSTSTLKSGVQVGALDDPEDASCTLGACSTRPRVLAGADVRRRAPPAHGRVDLHRRARTPRRRAAGAGARVSCFGSTMPSQSPRRRICDALLLLALRAVVRRPVLLVGEPLARSCSALGHDGRPVRHLQLVPEVPERPLVLAGDAALLEVGAGALAGAPCRRRSRRPRCPWPTARGTCRPRCGGTPWPCSLRAPGHAPAGKPPPCCSSRCPCRAAMQPAVQATLRCNAAVSRRKQVRPRDPRRTVAHCYAARLAPVTAEGARPPTAAALRGAVAGPPCPAAGPGARAARGASGPAPCGATASSCAWSYPSVRIEQVVSDGSLHLTAGAGGRTLRVESVPSCATCRADVV